ncbi:MAG: ATP-binding protein [Cyclobacteriaceae bacterium]
MAKELEIKVEKDHIESLTKASGVSAMSELIWNSLDADSNNILISFKTNGLSISNIEVEDDGHGMDYNTAEMAFQSIGGSNKKNRFKSPSDRVLHGKEGKGRLKAFALGDLIKFSSTYKDNGSVKNFEITLDRNNIKWPHVGDLKTLKKGEAKTGVQIIINNVNDKNAATLFKENGIKLLEEKFAVYYMSYPTFQVSINKHQLDFSSYIKNEYEESINIETTPEEGKMVSIPFKFKIIEWHRTCEKKMYLCGAEGISFHEDSLGIRTSNYQITVHILSKYVEHLHRSNDLQLGESNQVLHDAISLSKDIARKYIRDRKHEEARGFINELKKDGIYPYPNTAPSSKIEETQRKVFDIVALQLNEHLSEFSEQQKQSKQLTLSLIKEVLESDTSGLDKIFKEVIDLPDSKREDLKEILEKTSLSTIVDTMKEITDRLRIAYEIKLILFDKGWKDKVLERKHLHQIVKNETWLFGDDYTYGADDVNLKTVLKSYLKHLKREDFEEVVESEDNSNLQDIPDVCLWKQYNSGRSGHFENLVVELKRPNKRVGTDELDQIKKYARAVAKDDRFPKNKTKWVFILLVTEMNEDAKSECDQRDRDFGHIDTKDNYDVYVKKWGYLLNEAEARHEYLKNKLNYNISENEEGVSLLKKKYSEYLPEEIE